MIEIKDIVENELCTGCGLCISESNDSGMVWNEFGFLLPDISKTFTEKAIKLCPFNPEPDSVVEDEDKLADIFFQDSNKRHDKIGKYINTYVGYSKEYRETSSSGGIATFVFEQLLKRKIVDHLYVVKEVKGTYEYQLFSDFNDIKKISKTRYIPVTLAELFKQIDKIEGKVALSGVACFIKAVRLKQYYKPELREKIPFLVGIICGGLKSRFFTDYLAQVAGVEGDYKNQNYRIKDANSSASDYSFGTFDSCGSFKQVKMRTVGDMWGSGLFKSNACDFCTDVTTELADISLGDAWLEPYSREGMGNSVIVTRSDVANNIIIKGIEIGGLEVKSLPLIEFLASQQGSFNHRHLGLEYRFKLIGKGIKPKVRERFFEKISFDFRRVQRLRMQIRKNSLLEWKKNSNAESFESSIHSDRESLTKASILNHRIKRIKKMIGIK